VDTPILRADLAGAFSDAVVKRGRRMRKWPILRLSPVSPCGNKAESSLTFLERPGEILWPPVAQVRHIADISHNVALSAEKSHRWRLSSHFGRQCRLFAHNSDSWPMSANISNNGGVSADISHIDATGCTFSACTQACRNSANPAGIMLSRGAISWLHVCNRSD